VSNNSNNNKYEKCKKMETKNAGLTHDSKPDTIYNAIQCNTMQYNAIQFSTILAITIFVQAWYNDTSTMQYGTIV
jgi:hypothetical protein